MAVHQHGALADPKDFGNTPGRGPLHVGGRSVSAADAGTPKGDRPDTLSPAAAVQVPERQLCRDLWGGNSTVKSKGELYLPRAPGEKNRNYDDRLARSLFFNAFRQAVVGLVGLIFRKDPVLGQDVPEVIVEHWENIDLAGTHGDIFTRELEEDAMTVGHAAILVEFPTVDTKLNIEREKAEVRPYWVPVKKDQIRSWRTANLDGVTVLTQVVIQMDAWVADGEFGEKLDTTYLVINRDIGAKEESIKWRRMMIGKNNVVSTVKEGVYVNQTAIPLAEVITSGRVSMFVSSPPLVDLAFVNVAHYQVDSDYKNSIHKTCVPLLAIYGTDDDGGDIVVGADNVFTLQNPAAKVEYVSHSGAALQQVKESLDAMISEMAVLSIAMLAPSKRSTETAEAKRIDKATSDSALGMNARGLQDAIENALQFHANYLKIDDGGSVVVNRDFEGLLMDAPVMTAYAALRKEGFPPRFILRALQQGGRIPEDEDLEQLGLEMEGNRITEEERVALEKRIAEEDAANDGDGE